MATVQMILDGPRQVVIKVDGAGGDAGATILDPTLLTPPCTRVRLLKAVYSLAPTGTAQLTWDATSAVPIWNFFGGAGDKYNFCDTQGIPNNAGAGNTGKVLITSAASLAFSMYLTFIKSDPVGKL